MPTIVVKNAIKREKGKLYFIDKTGNVCCTNMKRSSKKAAPKKAAAKKKTAKRK